MSYAPTHRAQVLPVASVSPSSRPKPKPATPKPAEPSFICTICWQPQHPPQKPKLLGTSARITCRACWQAVLDLSICWVCGEYIVRGDEVVSLGWCFWHRACFGCLVCGAGLTVPKGFEDDEEEDSGVVGEVMGNKGQWGNWQYEEKKGRRRCVGVELEEIPLCSVCEIETAGESRNQVLQRGIEMVSKFDGGLSRDRLQMLSEDGNDLRVEDRRRLQSSRRSRAKTFDGRLSAKCSREQLRDSRHCPHGNADDQTPLLQNAAPMGVSDEYANLEPHYHSDSEKPHFSDIKPDVFVSILDPVKDRPFIPSKTKSHPQWMDLLPNNVFRGRLQQSQRRSNSQSRQDLTEKHNSETENDSKQPRRVPSWHGAGIQIVPPDEPTRAVDPTSGDTTPRKPSIEGKLPSTPKSIPKLDGPSTPGTPGGPPSMEGLTIGLPTGKTSSRRGRRTTISFDSNIKRERYEDLKDASATYQRSQHIEPAQSPIKESTAPPPQERTPWPPRGQESSVKPNDYFTNITTPVVSREWCCKSPVKTEKPITIPATGTLDEVACPAPVGQFSVPLLSKSSEYLERYKPQTPRPKVDKYVAKPPQPILEKLGRRRSVFAADEINSPDAKVEIRSLFGDREEGGKTEGERKVSDKGKERVGKSREALQKELETLFRDRQMGV